MIKGRETIENSSEIDVQRDEPFSPAPVAADTCRQAAPAMDPTHRRQATLAREEETRQRDLLSYRALFDSTDDGVFLFSSDNIILDANQRFCEMTGYARDELIGMSTSQLVPPDQRHNPDDRRARLLKGERVPPYLRVGLHKDGSIGYAEVLSAAVFQPDGAFSHFVSVVRPVTARIEMDARLRTLSRAVEQTPACVVITDPQGVIQYVNPAFERVTGFSRDEAVGATPRILKSGKMPQAVYESMWRTIAKGDVWSGEFCNRKKNGELYWDLGTVSPVRDEQGRIAHYVSVKEDITERKAAEQELERYRRHLEELVEARTADLRDREHRLADAQRIAHLGSWDWDVESNALSWSEETYRICGADPQTYQPTYAAFLANVHPDDRSAAQRELEKAVLERSPLSIDLRYLKPDATQRVLSLTVVPASDSKGNLTRVVGTLQDVSERTWMRQELVEKERMTRELAIGRSIQLSMLPSTYPQVAGWQFACHYQAAEQVGGDLYDFVPLSEHKLGVIIGDVSGHGLPAALYMALCRAVVRTTALSRYSPAKTLARSNKMLFEDYKGDEFATVCYGILNTQDGSFTMANAGHNPPLLYSAAAGTVTEVRARGTILGIQPRVTLPEERLRLAPGDALLLYTDGISEGFNGDGGQFGAERLRDIMATNGSRDAAGIVQALLGGWRDFVGGAVETDDATLLVIKRGEHAAR